jgi:hypothetical protein
MEKKETDAQIEVAQKNAEIEALRQQTLGQITYSKQAGSALQTELTTFQTQSDNYGKMKNREVDIVSRQLGKTNAEQGAEIEKLRSQRTALDLANYRTIRDNEATAYLQQIRIAAKKLADMGRTCREVTEKCLPRALSVAPTKAASTVSEQIDPSTREAPEKADDLIK